MVRPRRSRRSRTVDAAVELLETKYGHLRHECIRPIRHRFPGEESRVNVQEFLRRAVTLGGAEQAVPAVLLRIAARNDINQRAPIGQPIESRRHSRGLRRRCDAGSDRDQEPEPLGQRREGRSD